MTSLLPLGISNFPIASRSFPGRFESLAAIGQFVRSQAQECGLDEKAVYQVEMAVDEACSNIIEHAYGEENKGDISITCQSSEEGITITLRDQGAPFNPEVIPNPNLAADLEDRESHGLGLFFIREWMDRVVFENKPGEGNTLLLFKGRKKGQKNAPRKTAGIL